MTIRVKGKYRIFLLKKLNQNAIRKSTGTLRKLWKKSQQASHRMAKPAAAEG